ncbi:orotidine-5'-phosphate decarboxylase [Candidatus Azambacteria bacterium]|nr:orotidine-5'-phosphate decarboxylase [Candidatus Azambacteria bacterium]
MSIIDKYNKRVDKVNSLVCVGLDSDWEKIPDTYKKLPFPQFEFNKFIIDETQEYVAAFKPNSAFYEARGDQGIRELKMTMEYLQEKYPDILTINDAKRGDIGNTNQGYVDFILDWLGFDALTVSPYLGEESLQPFLQRADKGIIVLCRTSNPGSGEIQNLLVERKPLWHIIAERVKNKWNKNNNCLLVVGATYPEEIKVIRDLMGDMTLLMPGIGNQGGDVELAVKAGLNSQGKGLIINSSRAIIFSENPREEARKLRDEVNKFR